MVQPWQRVSFCSHNDSAHTLDFRRAGLPPLSADQGPRKLGHGSLVHPSLIHLILPLPTARAFRIQIQFLEDWMSHHSKI